MSILTEQKLNILQSPAVCFLCPYPNFTLNGGVCSTCKPKLPTNLEEKNLWLAPLSISTKTGCYHKF